MAATPAGKQNTANSQNAADIAIGRIQYDTTGQFLSPKSRKHYVSTHTPLAKKYSNPLGTTRTLSHALLLPLHKSGVTPSSPLASPSQRKAAKFKKRLEIYQRKRFRGFTARELYDVGALAALDNREWKVELGNPIHPIFRRSQWFCEGCMPRHRGAVPILGGEEGFWLADNPVVWDMLQPILRLATLMLMDQCRYSWLDALFNGSFAKEIHSSGKVLTHFQPRSQVDRITYPTNDLLRDQIMRMSNDVWFALHSGHEELSSGLAVKTINSNGITRFHAVYDRVEVNIAVELLQPLLRKDLTDAEVMAARLRVTTTLVHELAHAAWRTIVIANEQPSTTIEPYFANEPLSELGYSFMDKQGGPGLPNGGFFKTNWFNASNTSYRTSGGAPALNKKISEGQDDPFRIIDYWPVPTDWYCDIFKGDFWGFRARGKGDKAKAMKQTKFGVRVVQAPPLKGGKYFERMEWFLIDELLGEDERGERLREQERKFMAQRIEDAMVKSRRGGEDQDGDSDLDDDDLEGLSMEPPEVKYHCPRWDEITAYLFNNRGPLELALDTMTVLAVPAFYRYIRDRGGISLTPLEFRNFLGVASEKGELFRWRPYSGPGLIRRIPPGWPPSPTPPTPLPTSNPDMDHLEALDDLMSDPDVQTSLTDYCGQATDMDMENFKRWLFWRWGDTELVGLGREGFRDVVLGSLVDGGGYFTVGPKDIIRFLPYEPDSGSEISSSGSSSTGDVEIELDGEDWV